MEVVNYDPLNSWKEREVKCNNWLIKSGVYIPLPDKKEREDLFQAEPFLFQYQIPKDKCVITFDEAELDFIEARLGLNHSEFVPYFASPFDNQYLEEKDFGHKTLIKAENSSSFRSYFYDDFMIKVSQRKNKETHVTDKVLYSYQIERAVSISRYLNPLIKESSGIQVLKESFGCYLKDLNFPYGYIIRQIPQSVLDGHTSLISLVSYVSKHENGDESLLEKHLQGKTEEASEIFLKKIVENIIKAYLKAYWDFGVCLELHQQNTLLELDANDQLTGRIFCRDLDGARIDVDKVISLNYEFKSNFSETDNERIFEHKKIQSLKNGIYPELKDSLIWNGLTICAFRLYVMDSCFFLLDHFIREHDLRNPDILAYAYKIVNEEILLKSPRTFYAH